MDEEERYAEAKDEVQSTLENVLQAHHELNRRSTSLVRINILSISVIFAGVSFSNINISVSFIGGLLSFLYSIWSCVQVYQPRDFKRGISRKGAIQIDKDIQNSTNNSEISRKMLYAYGDAVSEAIDKYQIEKEKFQNGLWASISGIIFFTLAGGIHIIGGVPTAPELPLLIIIPMFALWGRDKTIDEDYDV